MRVWYKSCTALWYNSAGKSLLRIEVERDPSGRRKDDCFFSTDLNLSPKAILELFAQRWPLEVAFYNAKQFLGLEDPQNRTPKAVRAAAPIALYLHTMVILWFAKHGRFDAKAFRETHPWYTQKRTPSFAAAKLGHPRCTKSNPEAGYGSLRSNPAHILPVLTPDIPREGFPTDRPVRSA